ncbi:hypothetical protein H2200_006051 [Cladophialophora chaetospira]|uniref:Carbonic anhydrase n=1 Tax=Cladophialophora chaetospira TaxID=386627 RepID=A0AA38XAW6_9EURO|nr:hypothetical protein H2200_006051 [Cladophialophora chaetospira]
MAAGMRSTGAGVVVLSCSDPRLNPYQILGIDPTLKATMVRNAGGRAFDAIRTLSVLQTIGNPGTIVVMHHTDCGMTHYHDADIKKALLEVDPEAKGLIESLKFGEIANGIEDSIRTDIAILKASPLIKKSTQIIGLAYNIETGLLNPRQDNSNEDTDSWARSASEDYLLAFRETHTYTQLIIQLDIVENAHSSQRKSIMEEALKRIEEGGEDVAFEAAHLDEKQLAINPEDENWDICPACGEPACVDATAGEKTEKCVHEAYDHQWCYTCQKPTVDRAGFEKCPNEGRCEEKEPKNEEKVDAVEADEVPKAHPATEEEIEDSNQAEEPTLTAREFALWETDAYLFFAKALDGNRVYNCFGSSMPASYHKGSDHDA